MDSTDYNLGAEPLAIAFKNVSLSFDGKRVLDHVSFKARRGQMIIITGLSSSGKTVLLHLAIGLLHADEGQIFVKGWDIESLSERELLQLRSDSMGLVFQEDTLFTGMTVYDNAAYRLTEHGWPEEEADRAVEEILRFVGLENDMEKMPEELSVGMRRRLEIARGLAGWPPVMLFDEPTSGLDPINSRQVLDLIIRARDIHKISMLYVTKEMHEIAYLSEHYAEQDEEGETRVFNGTAPRDCELKVMVLEDGRVGFFGTPAEFESSALPAVSLLTNPNAGMRTSNTYSPDPWGKKRSPSTKTA